MKTDDFLHQLDEPSVVKAITEAELQTSGEIRVFVSEAEIEAADVIPRAKARFEKLGMTATRDRNAVLLYFVPKSQKFAIIGDTGIHEKCGQPFWDEVAAEMHRLFQEHKFTDAIVGTVQKVGTVLARHFPIRHDDTNELPNRVERG
ncbi:MAG: TPM domain-containing protein [Chthoniobacteraceae bacterium]